ncbi:MAG: type II toxin-antitoxin system PemK/MazF family toxin [Ginsengibacter sp.]
MKFKIVLTDFPFDNFSESKLRPALCLTNPVSKHRQIVLAGITSNLQNANEITDVIIQKNQIDFVTTGLKVSSVIKIHRLLTASDKIIRKVIGNLPESYHSEVYEKIKNYLT